MGAAAADPPGHPRPALHVLPGGEPDQVLRLAAFRAAHPEVVIKMLEDHRGPWQARIPEPDGELVITRYILARLLDKLEELFPPDG